MKLIDRARANPVAWIQKAFGAKLWAKQRTIVESFFRNRVTLVPSCHASGKSFTAAHAFLAALFLHPNCKVITTATTWSQVETILWAEIRAAYGRRRMDLGGPPPGKTQLELAPGWLGFGMSTDDPVRFQGQHAPGGVFIIVDEGDGVEAPIWDGIKANLSTGDCHLLVIFNPIDPESRVSAMCGDTENVVLPITAFETPNFSAFGITEDDIATGSWKDKIGDKPLPSPFLLSPQWVADVLREEGEDSPFYVSRVLARYPDVAEDALIKQAWIEKAWARWPEAKTVGERVLGLDVARFGDDKTVLAIRRGMKFEIVETGTGLDTEGAVSIALRWEALEHIESRQRALIFVDVAGVGAGVYDLLKKSTRCFAVDNATKATEIPGQPKRFLNKRAENYWNFREMLRTDAIALDPKDRALAQELRSMRFKITRGLVQIEEKAEIKKRLKRSPDRADAIVLAACGRFDQSVSFLEAMKVAGMR